MSPARAEHAEDGKIGSALRHPRRDGTREIVSDPLGFRESGGLLLGVGMLFSAPSPDRSVDFVASTSIGFAFVPTGNGRDCGAAAGCEAVGGS